MTWMTMPEAAKYLRRNRRFLKKEILAGRLRAAVVGGQREILTCPEWCDQWVIDQTTPKPIVIRRLGAR